MALTNRQLNFLRHSPIPPGGHRLDLALALVSATATDVARDTGFSAQWLSDVRRGRIELPTIGNARRLAKYFGCYIDDLFPDPADVPEPERERVPA